MAKSNSRSEGGQALVMIVLSSLLLFTVVGLVVDVGWARFRQQAAQAAADSAAWRRRSLRRPFRQVPHAEAAGWFARPRRLAHRTQQPRHDHACRRPAFTPNRTVLPPAANRA